MSALELPKRTWHWSILIVCVAAITTTLFWLALPNRWQVNESSDYSSYYAPVARNMIDGKGIRHSDGTLATKYPPGFSFTLAAMYAISDRLPFVNLDLINPFIVASVICSALLLFSIGQTLYPPRFAFVAVVLWLTYPIALWTLKQPNSEVAFLPVFLGAVALFWHCIRQEEDSYLGFFAVGILLGLAMLIRPAAIGLGFLFFFLLIILRRHEDARRWLIPGVLLLAGNIVVISPWLIWVYRQTNQLMLLSSNGSASILDGLTFAVNLKGYRVPIVVPPDVEQVMRTFLPQPPVFSSVSGVLQLLWSQLISTPLAMIKLLSWKAMRSWYATDSHRLELALMFMQLVYLVPIGLGAAAAWRRKGVSKQAAIMILMIMLYYWAMTMLVLSIVRYMMPAMALLMLLIPFIFVTTPFGRGFRFSAAE